MRGKTWDLSRSASEFGLKGDGSSARTDWARLHNEGGPGVFTTFPLIISHPNTRSRLPGSRRRLIPGI